MATKRFYILLLIFLWSLGSYLYLKENYNPLGVEIEIGPSVSYKSLEEISKKNRIPTYSLNYEMSYNDEKLIMTTGNDLFFIDKEIIYGDFISMNQDKVAVIGNRIVPNYFNTENPVGSSLTILGKDYIILGVLKNSNDLYISHNEKLADIRWDRAFFRYQPPLGYNFDVTVRDMRVGLKTNEIYLRDEIIYQEVISFHFNMMIVAILSIMGFIMVKPAKGLLKDCKGLWQQYQVEKRKIEAYRYILENIKKVRKVLLLAILSIVFLRVTYKLFGAIVIPTHHIPDNLFSPQSYRNIVNSTYKIWMKRMNIGVRGILLDSTLSNLGLMVVIQMIFMKWTFTTSIKNTIWREREIE